MCFVGRCLPFCPFSFGHYVVCPSIYGFWLPLWYLQTLLRYAMITEATFMGKRYFPLQIITLIPYNMYGAIHNFKYLIDLVPCVYLRDKPWKPECVLSFNMGWRILVFSYFINIRQPMLKLKNTLASMNYFWFWYV